MGIFGSCVSNQAETEKQRDQSARPDVAPSCEGTFHKRKVSSSEIHREMEEGGRSMGARSTDQENPLIGHTFVVCDGADDEDWAWRLVDKEGHPFKFHVSEHHAENDQRYERLGEGVSLHIYSLLENYCDLDRHYIPVGRASSRVTSDGGDDPRGFFFASKNALTTRDRLLILIHGSGAVRAGQWARSVIINDNLQSGSQLPYIQLARAAGYEVIVLNTNHNFYRDGRGKKIKIKGSEDAETHAMYVWQNYVVSTTKAKHVAIVAHSYGGVVAVHMACHSWAEFSQRVFAVALSDSVHSLGLFHQCRHLKDVCDFFHAHARNWVRSDLPLDDPVSRESEQRGSARVQPLDAPRVSAGTMSHAWTSDKSKRSVFNFLSEQYELCKIPPSRTPSNTAALNTTSQSSIETRL